MIGFPRKGLVNSKHGSSLALINPLWATQTRTQALSNPMTPLCFVLMPFGMKIDSTGRQINFDKVYGQVIAPAISAAGLDPIRADDEVTGGMIHKAMFERLLLCDYAIADLTHSNSNVAYELGIRHAVRPRSTLVLFAEGTSLPFDMAPLRAIPYRTDQEGNPVASGDHVAIISERLKSCRQDTRDDSPLFQLIDFLPRISFDAKRSDRFRDRIDVSNALKARIRKAGSKRGGGDDLQKLADSPEMQNFHEIDPDVLVILFNELHARQSYSYIIDYHSRLPAQLRRQKSIQQRVFWSLKRTGRFRDAEAVLRQVLEDYGPSSEVLGWFGSLHRDLWKGAIQSGDKFMAEHYLKQAIEYFLEGFLMDWRDMFTGMNTVSLMEIAGDPRRLEILPVVSFGASQKYKIDRDYWGCANRLKLSLLSRNEEDALNFLGEMLTLNRERWELEATLDDICLLREVRAARNEDVTSIVMIEEIVEKHLARQS